MLGNEGTIRGKGRKREANSYAETCTIGVVAKLILQKRRVADVTSSYAACEKGYWVEMVRCSKRFSSSVYNDSSGGR